MGHMSFGGTRAQLYCPGCKRHFSYDVLTDDQGHRICPQCQQVCAKEGWNQIDRCVFECIACGTHVGASHANHEFLRCPNGLQHLMGVKVQTA